ncbi:MAG: hypothetical protein CK542_04230 [Acidimicrobium sp.]|nr:MAG: hypothetical protein CK542_04230 [Acidimicrobium sp.]
MSDLVRVGRNADGGYLFPKNVLNDVSGCLSFGLGAEWSFETYLLEMSDGKVSPERVVFFDASISILGLLKSIIYMGRRTAYELRIRCPKSERKFRLEDLKRSLIALIMYLPTFRFGKNRLRHIRRFVTHDAKNKNEISFERALSHREDPRQTIVKIDIEGGEWDLLCEVSDVAQLADAPVLIVEFHDTRRPEFMKVVSMIKEYFWIAHLHGNTSDRATEVGMPLYLEMTFINKRYSPRDEIRKKLPIDGLDFPGRPGEAPHEFEFNN